MKKLPRHASTPSAPPRPSPLPSYGSGHASTSYASPDAATPTKVSSTDKAREHASHALQKGQSALGAFFHHAAGTVQSHTQSTRAGDIGGQTAHFLDMLAYTIDGPVGQSPEVQALVTEGGQLLQNALAQLPEVVPGKKINGHPVRQYHEWIANIRVE